VSLGLGLLPLHMLMGSIREEFVYFAASAAGYVSEL
jgi:hypothetical protein